MTAEVHIAAHVAYLGAPFRSAVAGLHSREPAACRKANEWLVTFAADPAAPSVCENFLVSQSATMQEQLFAAGILSRAARSHGVQALGHLLRLCNPPACRQAISSLAVTAAAIAVSVGSEETLLHAPPFADLSPDSRIIVLHAVADALMAHNPGAENSSDRPASVAACRRAVGATRGCW